MSNRMQPAVRGWQDWCAKWRDPAVLLALVGAISAACTWGIGFAMDESQLLGRVASLEKRSDQQATALSQFQEKVGEHIEGLEGKVNQFALELAGVTPRLEGMMELLKTIKENEIATEQRIIDADHMRDETARMQDSEWSRRFDSLSAVLRTGKK